MVKKFSEKRVISFPADVFLSMSWNKNFWFQGYVISCDSMIWPKNYCER